MQASLHTNMNFDYSDIRRIERVMLCLSLVALLFYLYPLLTDAEMLYVPPFDFLDIAFPSAKILANSGMMFADNSAIIPNMMGGLPRLSYGSEFNYFPWLFKIVDGTHVYVINEIMMHTVAFAGMLMFLRYGLFSEKRHSDISTLAVVYGVALLYAILPFFPGMGLSIPALPLALYLFLRIKDGKSTGWVWGVLLLLPLFTSFVLVYSFFLMTMSLWWAWDTVRERPANIKWLMAIVAMTAVYLMVEYRLVLSMLFDTGYVSHRMEFVRRFLPFMDAYRGAHNAFLLGQSHTRSMQAPYVIPSILFVMLLGVSRNALGRLVSVLVGTVFVIALWLDLWAPLIRSKYFLPFLFVLAAGLFYYRKGLWRVLAGGVIALIASSIWYGFWYYEGWHTIVKLVPIVRTYDFSRFVLLNPPVWYALFALSLVLMMRVMGKAGVAVAIITMALQGALLFQSKTFFPNPSGLNLQRYYDRALFEKAAAIIGQPKESYRIASVGIPPAVALYNGFYALDGYSPNYPLEYKHRFEKVISDNFIDNKQAEQFFKNWGSKCYVIAGNKGYDVYERGTPIRHFRMDTDAFYQMGGRYVFSAYSIEDASSMHLKLLKYYPNGKGFWSLWVYKVMRNKAERETL
jgi:hypothetical protein